MIKHAALIASVLVASLVVFSRAPVAQDPRYHAFADGRTLFGLKNAYNVLSNLLFVLAGAGGLLFILGNARNRGMNMLALQYLLFFAGIFLTGIASGFYHFEPSNATLLWDRLPMAIGFMALLSSVISESISRKAGSALLVPLLALGVLSVLYWSWTENAARGNLRPYILVQFLPLVLVPAMLLLYKAPKNYASAIWSLAALYAAAKAFELLDKPVYDLTGFASGHTIKHLLAALGSVFVLKMLVRRKNELFAVEPAS